MSRLQIYLADLTHTGKGIATEAFPLNIGLIASYLQKAYGTELEISLFKYPGDLKEAITQRVPHVLGCSNYTWNSNLSYYFCKLVKSLDPTVLTVFGGTNYPFATEQQDKFLRARPALDLHVFYEGEHAFDNVVKRRLSGDRESVVNGEPIPGCQYIEARSGRLSNGSPLPRIKDLDSIPSPYVNGLLDKFFDGKLTPFVETARGCPFLCNFCNAGDTYFNKVNLFSNSYVEEELSYIAQKASKLDIAHLTLADNNFGMIPRDGITAKVIYDLQRRYGWPRSMTAWTGKNSKERVIEVTRLLGSTFSISMSVQSMDEEVLKNVERDNIKLDHYRAIAQELNAQGRPQHAEVILPLPGESLKSHIDGLKSLLDSDVDRVLSHTLQMLHGTPYKDDDAYRKRYEFVSKYRLVPLDFSRMDNECVFDVEEVAVASNTLSFQDYVDSRKYLLVIDLCHNSGIFGTLQKYLRSWSIKRSDWIQEVYNRIAAAPEEVRRILKNFEDETVSELWDSETELVAFYSKPQNYEKLLSYEAGGNVLFKHRVWMMSDAIVPWVEMAVDSAHRLLTAGVSVEEISLIERELLEIKQFILNSIVDCLSPMTLGKTLECSFNYDIPRWLAHPHSAQLTEFLAARPVALRFYLDDRATTIMNDAFRRYDSDLAGLIKMLQRLSGVTFSRQVAYADEHQTPRDIAASIGTHPLH